MVRMMKQFMDTLRERLLEDQGRSHKTHYTIDPIFMVQKQVRVYGLDMSFTDDWVWLYTDDHEEVTDEEKLKELWSSYDRHNTPKWAFLTGYYDEWVNIQPFFTTEAAEDYIRTQSHRHSEPLRVFVESAYRNPEWTELRKYIMIHYKGHRYDHLNEEENV